MHTIDDVQAILTEIADEIPDVFFRHLNGGVILQAECKFHPQGAGDLYIMGDYANMHTLGRRINIYYGSFMRVYAHAPAQVLREKLRATLLHEFTHHLESLAGERGLEIRDKVEIEEYKRRNLPDENL